MSFARFLRQLAEIQLCLRRIKVIRLRVVLELFSNEV